MYARKKESIVHMALTVTIPKLIQESGINVEEKTNYVVESRDCYRLKNMDQGNS